MKVLFSAQIHFDNEQVETGHFETKDLLTHAQFEQFLIQVLQVRYGPVPWETKVEYSDENKRWEWRAKRANTMEARAALQEPKIQMPPGTSRN